MNKKYQINDRVFVSDSSGKYSATITDICHEADGSGYLYQCSYDGGGYDWLTACEIEPMIYNIGDHVTSEYGNGVVVEVGEHTIEVEYDFVTVPHLEHEIHPDNTVYKQSFLKRLFQQYL